MQVFQQLEQRLGHLVFMQHPHQPALNQPGASDQTSAGVLGSVLGSDPHKCPACGGQLVLKPSKVTGGFIGCR